MRLVIELPPELEDLLIEKAEQANIKPEEFVYKLIEWYFSKKKSESSELREFLNAVNEIALEKIKNCKFSDGNYCSLEALEDIFSDAEPKKLSKYRCLFCVYYVDRRKEKRRQEIADMRIHEIARLSAKYLFELYGDKLGYRPKIENKEVKANKIEKLLDW
ncbi:MAG: hypothetical protein PWQ22_132 [Archaeoglobaceae archaeon]|nr:hypothetical protein [Archaeoglobaceae archaeon]MDK2875722.1 hypothetical protein [Archaeoglobaceae archaeon]